MSGKFIKINVKVCQLLCIALMMAIAFAGVRMLLNDLITPAHIHESSTMPSEALATQMHEHNHENVGRHIHEPSVRSFEMIIASDHETGDHLSAEKSVSKLSFDCDLLAIFLFESGVAQNIYSYVKEMPLVSAVAPRLDRPPISL
jgi:hypothetical protein